MTWMNEYDVNQAVRDFNPAEVPNLAEGARILSNLVDWTDTHSDGWSHWPKPAKAADRLMVLLSWHTYAARFGHYQGTARPLEDATKAELTKALTPIKAFLTRQGVAHAEVLA